MMDEKLELVRRALYSLAAFILLLLFSAVLDASYRPVEGPEIEAPLRAKRTDHAQQKAEGEPAQPVEPSAGAPRSLSSEGHGKREADAENGGQDRAEREPGFLGTSMSADSAVAIFTLCLVVATVALVVATFKLVKGADRNAERQLRAYVGVHGGVMGPMQIGSKLNGSIDVRNFGQTPAHNLSMDIEIFQYIDGKIILCPDKQEITEKLYIILYPGQIRVVKFEWTEPLTPDEFDTLSSGRQVFVLKGQIAYRDVFGRKQTTSVHLYNYGGRPNLTTAMDGNDAT